MCFPLTLPRIRTKSSVNLTPGSRSGTRNADVLFDRGPETRKVWLRPNPRSVVCHDEEEAQRETDVVQKKQNRNMKSSRESGDDS